jgi:pimeloyl-ACP methyl ester carboxylesterase
MNTLTDRDGITTRNELAYERAHLRVDDVDLSVATVARGGELTPLVFLHGFGSTKEDYVDIAYEPVFDRRPLLAYDAPGCGEATCEDLSRISIPFLVETAVAVLQQAGIRRFHLVGHSMGGLTALMLAHQDPDRVLSFINIEGNIAPEDCFLSRQVLTHPSDYAESFFDDFIERTRRSPFYSNALFLSKLDANGVELVRIPYSAHFPMYSNPRAMWDRIIDFHSRNKLD